MSTDITESKPGWIYIMSNSSIPYLKIGQTTDDPNTRAGQLSAPTSAPTPFHVAYCRKVPNCNLAERAIHSALANCRVNESREFFKTSVYEAARILDSLLVETFSMHEPPTPFAELFATFADSDDPNLDEEERAACRALEARLAAT
jgi:T5orf172 domain-containing protein